MRYKSTNPQRGWEKGNKPEDITVNKTVTVNLNVNESLREYIVYHLSKKKKK